MAKYQAYAEYKNSGVEWLGKIPSHWLATQVKYGYLVTLGKMLQSTPKSSLDELKLYLKAQNIQPNGINIDQVESMWFSPDECKKLLLQKSDVLVSEGGDAGRSAIWNCELEECYIQNAINRVRPKYVNNSKYFLYWMKFLKSTDFINIICNKATIAHYTAEKLEGSPIFLPSSDEQKNIANFLDHETTKIDHLIEKQQQLIELLKEKRQAVISHAVTKGLNPNVPMKDSGVEWLGEVPEHWKISRLKYNASIFGRIGFRGYTVDDIVDEGEGALVLSPSNISNANKLTLEKKTYLSWKKYFESPEIIVDENDLLLVKTGSTFGKSAIIFNKLEPMTINPQMALIKKSKIEPRFLGYLFSSKFIKSIIENSNTGSGMPTMTQENINNFPIPLPSDEEATIISNYLDNKIYKIDFLIEKSEQTILLMQERRTALISAAVTGKIDVRNWQAPTVAEADTELST
ncbi:restriction endonuclease subunit S [Acinetobacter sp. SM1B]|uniref:restriction endonuclease subunit S n=1 Tax=Acinetobacter sp. SM1B TaxID=1497337 RepID=UPI000DCC7BA6|nr:restriction endonuclease subunit S [Acinetobacter sp. SM1B]RAZ03729.1 restriction endonuclease subunit S [Acinetobacter sp. SM1B]